LWAPDTAFDAKYGLLHPWATAFAFRVTVARHCNSLHEDEDADGFLLPPALLLKMDELWIIQNSPEREEVGQKLKGCRANSESHQKDHLAGDMSVVWCWVELSVTHKNAWVSKWRKHHLGRPKQWHRDQNAYHKSHKVYNNLDQGPWVGSK
jgi:hypothetical protein